MAIDKLNSLQFLLFRSDYFQEFGDRDGVYVDRVHDAAWKFQRHRDRLIACTWYVGFDDAAEAALRALLAR